MGSRIGHLGLRPGCVGMLPLGVGMRARLLTSSIVGLAAAGSNVHSGGYRAYAAGTQQVDGRCTARRVQHSCAYGYETSLRGACEVGACLEGSELAHASEGLLPP